MARIPDGVVERLKAEISVQRLAEARGVELKRHGADLHGRCPFHDDRTPSLVITQGKNLWHCLGACQAGGTVIVERIFAYPGIGNLAIDAVINRDFPLIQGLVLLFGLIFIMINIGVDLTVAALNPRLRHA